MNIDDELISNFMSITRSDISSAKQYLTLSNGDLDSAINLFYGEVSKKPNTTPTTKPASVINSNQNKPKIFDSITKPKIEKKEEKKTKRELCPLFTEARDKARSQLSPRLLFVSIYRDAPTFSLMKNELLRDLFNINYTPLEIIQSTVDGLWFSNTYSVSKYPFYAIIDPVTIECLKSCSEVLTPNKAFQWLRQFLISNPKYGLPVDIQADLLDIEVENSQNSYSSDDKPVQDIGTLVPIMLQLPNGKRIKEEVGLKQTIKSVYKITEDLMGQKQDTFKLVIFPSTELTEMNKTVEEMKLKGNMIRVVENSKL